MNDPICPCCSTVVPRAGLSLGIMPVMMTACPGCGAPLSLRPALSVVAIATVPLWLAAVIAPSLLPGSGIWSMGLAAAGTAVMCVVAHRWASPASYIAAWAPIAQLHAPVTATTSEQERAEVAAALEKLHVYVAGGFGPRRGSPEADRVVAWIDQRREAARPRT